MVNVTIDGKQIEVAEGTTVLQAARSAEIHIPTLCDHPHLTPYGGCRLCLVEVEGARILQPSCTLPVSNNMIVHTDTPKTREARKFVLTLIFSERNHFCPYCQVSGGDCELQNAAYGEGMTHWPLQPNWQGYKVDASHPYFILEHNRCILCRRCVRACNELVGNNTLGFEERGANSTLVADLGVPLGESSCISCGVCVQICPTGALIDRWSAYQGKDTEAEHVKTICVGCSVGCGVENIVRDNNLIRVDGDWDAPISEGILCKVGRFYPKTVDQQRIITPLIRKDNVLKAATWDEALDVIAGKIKESCGKNTDGVAAMASTRLPIESLYLFKQIFADHLKGNIVTSTEEGQNTVPASALADMMGKPFEGKLSSIKDSDAILTIGVDLIADHEVVGFFVKRLLPGKAKLVCIEGAETPFDMLAESSLKMKKGSNLDIIEGLSAAVVKLGLAKEKVNIQPDNILKSCAEKTGVPSDEFLKAAHILAGADKPVIIYGEKLAEDNAPDVLKSLVEFAKLIGAFDGKKSSLIGVKGGANSLAAAQLNLDKAFKLNGQKVAYIAIGDDKPAQRLVKTLENGPFLIVQASYSSQLTAMADVVLPVNTWLEEDGHYISLDGRLQLARHSLLSPVPEIKSNESVLNAVADKLGVKIDMNWQKNLAKRVSSVIIE